MSCIVLILLIFFCPVIDALSTEEIATSSTFFRSADNVGADGTVKNVTRKVWESVSVETKFAHFVEFNLVLLNI